MIDICLIVLINNIFMLMWLNGEVFGSLMFVVGVSYDVVKMLGLKLVVGCDFSCEFVGDWVSCENGVISMGIIVIEFVVR